MDALTYAGFGFRYEGAAECVLRSVDWTVPKGAFALVVGNTGSGKTTLLRSAKPEIAPVGAREGEVRLFGEAMRAGVRTPEVGFVFQNPENQIVCDTVWHELAFGLENLGVERGLMRRRVAEVAHFFGIEPWFHQRTDELSGGQKQLVNLAAVLALRPRLLLLDEPTAQLDPVACGSFLHALFRVNRELGITVVVSTHALELMADYATCAVVVEDGRVKACSLDDVRGGGSFPLEALRAWSAGRTDASALCARAPQGVGAGRRRVDVCEREAIALHDVFFRYESGAPWVLRGMNLGLPGGGIHAIVGGNGCGKSTLLRCIAGVLAPKRGRVRNAFMHEQALLPQDPQALFACDTVREELEEWSRNVGCGEAEISAMMERLGIEELGGRHPRDVSGGQQQKVALAKLLLAHPRLLLLDEPAKGLDALSRLELAHILLDEREKGCVMVMVTHDLSFAACVADSMTMLFDGEVACSQSVYEFCRENLFYRPQFDGLARLLAEGASVAGTGGERTDAGGARPVGQGICPCRSTWDNAAARTARVEPLPCENHTTWDSAADCEESSEKGRVLGGFPC